MSDLIKYCKATALDALSRISNFCEEIDLHLPEEERTGYSMLEDLLFLRRYILDNSALGWISVKDRLPKYSTDVLVCTKYYGVMIAYFDESVWKAKAWLSFTDPDYIIAWMPLPKLYVKE